MTVAGMVALLTLLAVAFSPEEELSTRAEWPTVLFALFDGVIAVGMTLWLVAFIRRWWPTPGPLLAKAGRASYATYFVHPLVLTTLMMLFSSIPLEPGIKFALVAAVAVPVASPWLHAHPAAGHLQGLVNTGLTRRRPSGRTHTQALGGHAVRDAQAPPIQRCRMHLGSLPCRCCVRRCCGRGRRSRDCWLTACTPWCAGLTSGGFSRQINAAQAARRWKRWNRPVRWREPVTISACGQIAVTLGPRLRNPGAIGCARHRQVSR